MSELTVLQDQIKSVAEKVDKILESLGTLIRVDERQSAQAATITRIETSVGDHETRLRKLEQSQTSDDARGQVHSWLGNAIWAFASALITGVLLTAFNGCSPAVGQRKADVPPAIIREESSH